MLKLPLFSVIVSLAMLVLPASALAAPEAVPDRLHVQVWPEQEGQGQTTMLLLESAEYPKNAKPPIEVKMALPKGAQVQWAGEVFGGKDPSKDISVRHELNPKSDYDEVVLTLTKARIAQVEAAWSGLRTDGAKRTITMPWVQRYPAKAVYFAFKTPSGAGEISMNPPVAYTDKDADGLTFYGSGPLKLDVGQKQTVTFSYTPGAGTASDTGQSSNSNLALALLVIVLGGGAIAFTIYSQAKKGTA